MLDHNPTLHEPPASGAWSVARRAAVTTPPRPDSGYAYLRSSECRVDDFRRLLTRHQLVARRRWPATASAKTVHNSRPAGRSRW
jgi:hypothetical protein